MSVKLRPSYSTRLTSNRSIRRRARRRREHAAEDGLADCFSVTISISTPIRKKNRRRGENDATMATAVFTDISRKFSQAQMLQQALLLNVSNAFHESAVLDERVIAAKYAKSVSDTYEKSWVALLESGDLMARVPNPYRLGNRLQARSRLVALSQQRSTVPIASSAYDFDCNDNLPKFVPTKSNRKRITGNLSRR